MADLFAFISLLFLVCYFEYRFRQIRKWYRSSYLSRERETNLRYQDLLDISIWVLTHYLPNRTQNIQILCQQATYTHNDRLARVSLAQIRYQNQQIIKVAESMSFYASIAVDYNYAPVMLDSASIVRHVVRTLPFNCRDRTVGINVSNIPKVLGDEVLFKKIIEILLDNAIRYSDPELPLYVNVGSIQAPTGFCGIQIVDTGIGLSPMQINKIMIGKVGSKFNDRSGVGLGWTIVRKIMDIHAAKWKINSKRGHGTTVSLFFPL